MDVWDEVSAGVVDLCHTSGAFAARKANGSVVSCAQLLESPHEQKWNCPTVPAQRGACEVSTLCLYTSFSLKLPLHALRTRLASTKCFLPLKSCQAPPWNATCKSRIARIAPSEPKQAGNINKARYTACHPEFFRKDGML